MRTKTTTAPATLAELADRYQVSSKTITRWRQRGAPLRDPARLAIWASAQQRPPAGLIARLLELREGEGSEPRANQPQLGKPDPDWADFVTVARTEPGKESKASLDALVKAREFAAYKLAKASEAGDRPSQRFYADLLSKLAGTIHDAELRALKMGRDLGESYSAEDVKRLGRAIGFWLMQGADSLITQAAKELAEAAAAAPLDREAVRRVMDPLVISERVVAPMVRATKMEAGVSLPKVFVESLRAGLDAVVEQTPA
jgi:hypothetical protein